MEEKVIPNFKIVMPEAHTLTTGDVDLSVFSDYGHVENLDHASYDELKEALRDADALFVNKIRVNEDLIKDAKNLKYIGECATGYNNIDIEYCNAHGITVTNVPTYSTSAVAQQAFAYILEHYSRVSDYNKFVHDGGWITADTFAPFVFSTDELQGKTIGLVGYGKIGKAVAKIADAFGMTVLVNTRSYEKSKEMGSNTELEGFINHADKYITYVTFDNLLRHSDIVSIHCPLNDESRHLFNAETISKMRNGAFLINTARGPIVDEEALVAALKSGKLSGAAVDVLDEEPMQAGCKLMDAENCIITPHVAWAPKSTRQRLVNEVIKNYKAFQDGKPINTVTNF